MTKARATGWMALGALALAGGGCTSITEQRGYVFDDTLASTIQPGIDDQRSVAATMGRPSFTSEYGQPTWYYVHNATSRGPLVSARITDSRVLAVRFDDSGNVAAIDRSGMENVVHLSPDGDKTPTLGRERSFFEDLFGNIGSVGAGQGPMSGSNTGP
ncbi:outer membrane protein assembly factor BamE [Erythrobacter sp. 3-20A1M]|uniref:outer membrane protein assembly factor BamE n=1 Tax=Erythrobacter sp. 3-20A1M TaxID=2653850 RepID=UPI00203F194B|nr:outer membrane protein assembly factor BamE [Erythrobacter sp. 3-20A1M]